MSQTTLKQRIQDGQMPVGTMVFEFFAPGLAQIAAAAGAEFVMYDMEHSGIGIEAIKAQCAFCAGVGVAPLVRVPTNQYHLVAGVLDAGAHGVMVPMVADADQARDIVSWSRYPPRVAAAPRLGSHTTVTPAAPHPRKLSPPRPARWSSR